MFLKEKSKTQHFSRRQTGFTLIEMLVAVGIFSIMMTIAMGALLSIMDANAKSQVMKSVINNVNFAAESMSKAIRVGSSYHCGSSGVVVLPQDCASGDNYFVFEGANGDAGMATDQIAYRYNSVDKSIERSIDGGVTFVAMTAPEVVIDSLSFYVDGSYPSDKLQPKVVISIKGHANSKAKLISNFNLQTTVVQRLFDS